MTAQKGIGVTGVDGDYTHGLGVTGPPALSPAEAASRNTWMNVFATLLPLLDQHELLTRGLVNRQAYCKCGRWLDYIQNDWPYRDYYWRHVAVELANAIAPRPNIVGATGVTGIR